MSAAMRISRISLKSWRGGVPSFSIRFRLSVVSFNCLRSCLSSRIMVCSAIRFLAGSVAARVAQRALILSSSSWCSIFMMIHSFRFSFHGIPWFPGICGSEKAQKSMTIQSCFHILLLRTIGSSLDKVLYLPAQYHWGRILKSNCKAETGTYLQSSRSHRIPERVPCNI